MDGEAEIDRRQAGPEAKVIRLDQRDAIALVVHDAQVNRVSHADLGVAGGDLFHRLRGVDQLSARGGVFLGNQPLRRDLGELRIGVILRPVGIGEFLRLGQQVPVVGRGRPEFLEIKRLQDVEHLKSSDALAGRGQFPHIVTAIAGPYRVGPLGGVPGEVLGRQQAALAFRERGQFGGDVALVKRIASLAGDLTIGGGEGGVFEDLTDLGGVFAIGKEGFDFAGLRVLPVAGNHLGHRHTLVGIGDAGRQQLIESHRAEAFSQFVPAIDTTGDRPTQRTGGRNLVEALFREQLSCGRQRRPAIGLQAVQFL